ncbi:hypothetical protein ABVT39_022076 [Epinephelus coioides]
MFDHHVDQVLETTLAGDMGKKFRAMASIIWSIGADRFGKKELKAKTNIQPKENRHLKEIAVLRGDLRRLRKAFREKSADEKPAITEIRDNLRERIKTLRRAECNCRDRKRRMKKRTDLPRIHLNTCRNFWVTKDLGSCRQQRRKWRSTSARAEEPSWQKVNTFLRKARAKSAPGPNSIP